MEKYKTIIFKHIDHTLIKQWKDLWEKADNANIFNSYEWFLTSKCACKISEYEIYACYNNNNLVAIIPLYFTKCFGIKVAKPIGYKFSNTPFLTIKYNIELFQFFFTQIIEKYNIYIPKVDLKAVKTLHNTFPMMFFSLSSVNPYINLNDNSAGFISNDTNIRVKKLIKKKANQFYLAKYEDQKDLMKYLKIMFNIEQRSSKKIKNIDLFSKEENRNYFINIVKYCSSFIQIFLLYYNNVPIAYDFILKYKNVFFSYQCAYLAELKKISPGIVMTYCELDNLGDTSFDIFDLGGGISSYKQRFTSNYYFLYDVWFSKNTFIMYWWKLVNLTRRVNQILFPVKHSRDHEFLFKTFS